MLDANFWQDKAVSQKTIKEKKYLSLEKFFSMALYDKKKGYYIDIGCHSFCLSGYLHDDEAIRFGKWVKPILEEKNPERLKK